MQAVVEKLSFLFLFLKINRYCCVDPKLLLRSFDSAPPVVCGIASRISVMLILLIFKTTKAIQECHVA